MKTLYDLIGALPEDDADELRAAFRRAVKEKHPDLNPDDPEASLDFRRIVRANAILSDPRQRGAYDQMLDNARREALKKPERSGVGARIRRFGVDAMVSAVASILVIGGYFVLRPADRLPPTQSPKTEMTRFEAPQTVAAQSTDLSSQERVAAQARSESMTPSDGSRPEAGKVEEAGTGGLTVERNAVDVKHDARSTAPGEPVEVASLGPEATIGGAAAAPPVQHAAPGQDASPAPEAEAKDVYFYRKRGISAYRNGDFTIALANFDLAIQQDPACADCYVDRGIVLHRMGDFRSAFHDVAEARRIDLLKRMESQSDSRAH